MTKDTTTFVSPEFGIRFENYLNIYHGMGDKVDPAKISHFIDLTPEQSSDYESFVKEVEAHDFDAVVADTTTDNCSIPYVLPDKITLLRFLMADDFKSDLALQRLENTVKFQQEQRLAEKISTTPPRLNLYRRIRVRANMGRTKDGMPIFVERLGGFMNGIPSKEGKSFSNDEWVHCFFYDLGELIREIKDSYEFAEKNQSPAITWKVTWIMDAKGISYYKALKSLSVIKLLDNLMEPNFPEIAGPIYMINVPYIVSGIWKLAKAFLDPAVVAKIQISSGVPKEVLLERIDESVLFQEYGGMNKKEFPKSDYV